MTVSLQGSFLISAHHLRDPNFYRSVVLLLEQEGVQFAAPFTSGRVGSRQLEGDEGGDEGDEGELWG